MSWGGGGGPGVVEQPLARDPGLPRHPHPYHYNPLFTDNTVTSTHACLVQQPLTFSPLPLPIHLGPLPPPPQATDAATDRPNHVLLLRLLLPPTQQSRRRPTLGPSRHAALLLLLLPCALLSHPRSVGACAGGYRAPSPWPCSHSCVYARGNQRHHQGDSVRTGTVGGWVGGWMVV